MLLVVLSLAGGVAGGLLRACTAPVPGTTGAWLVAAEIHHAALMVGGFLGTVISIERAVALQRAAAFVAPVASGLGGLLILMSLPAAGAWLLVIAGVAFVGVNVALVKRQDASHTRLLLAAAAAWLAGNLCLAAGDPAAAFAWWFAFLVATIAAERLEMTRLMRRRRHVEPLMGCLMATMFGGAALTPWAAAPGAALFGSALVGLAAWLLAFDVARRTVANRGLSRYMAVCLLTGYAWLAVSGVAWVAMGAGLPLRDAAIHALGLGFVVSMMMAHAPVVLPALARIPVRFGNLFYLPLAILDLSLLVRLGLGHADLRVRGLGAALNAVALACFALAMLVGAIGWRLRAGARSKARAT